MRALHPKMPPWGTPRAGWGQRQPRVAMRRRRRKAQEEEEGGFHGNRLVSRETRGGDVSARQGCSGEGPGWGGPQPCGGIKGHRNTWVPTAAGRGEFHFWGDKGAVPQPTQQPHSPSQQPLLEGHGHQPTSPTQQPPRSGSSKMRSGQRCLHTHPRAQPSQHSTPCARSHPHAAVCPRATHTCAHVCTPLGHSCTHTVGVNRV